MISLVKTEGNAEFRKQLGRACVAISRHKITMYLVGNWQFWSSTRAQTSARYAHNFTTIIEVMKQMLSSGLRVCNASQQVSVGELKSPFWSGWKLWISIYILSFPIASDS